MLFTKQLANYIARQGGAELMKFGCKPAEVHVDISWGTIAVSQWSEAAERSVAVFIRASESCGEKGNDKSR